MSFSKHSGRVQRRVYTMGKTSQVIEMKQRLIALGTIILLLGSTNAHAWGYGGHYGGRVGIHYGYHGWGKAADYLVGGLILGGILSYALTPRHRHYQDSGYHGSYSYRSYPRYYPPQRSYRVYSEVITRPHHSRTHTHSYSSSPLVRQQSHLHRDRHGNCFRISYGRNGQEFRSELPKSECAW